MLFTSSEEGQRGWAGIRARRDMQSPGKVIFLCLLKLILLKYLLNIYLEKGGRAEK